MTSLVTIIIRTYNNEDKIIKSINSALGQSYQNLEVLVINDGSTDETANRIKSIFDQRIRVINQKQLGSISAAYTGIENANGDYITFLDADDELMLEAIDSLYKPLKNSSYGFSYCDYIEIDLSKKTSDYISLTNLFNILACGVMFKSIVIKNIEFWDKSYILPEYDYIIRVLKKYKGVHVKTPLYKYYRHSKSMTADKKLMKKAKLQIYKKYGHIEGLKKY